MSSWMGDCLRLLRRHGPGRVPIGPRSSSIVRKYLAEIQMTAKRQPIRWSELPVLAGRDASLTDHSRLPFQYFHNTAGTLMDAAEEQNPSARRCRDRCLERSRRRCSGGTLSSRHCLALATELHSSRPDAMGHAIGKIQSAALDSVMAGAFDSHDLIHNRRRTLRVVVSEQGDGGFAVVDVDTLWRSRRTQEPFHWEGRACKLYIDGCTGIGCFCSEAARYSSTSAGPTTVAFGKSTEPARPPAPGRAETTTLADGMPLGIRPLSKSKLDELWRCGKLARGASDRCSVGTAASY